MIKIAILNACMGFLVQANFARLDAHDAKTIQHAANTCGTSYKGCLVSIHIKEYGTGGKHYGATCGMHNLTPKLRESLGD